MPFESRGDVPAELEGWVRAWGEERELGQRRTLEGRIAEAMRASLRQRLSCHLRRSGPVADAPAVDDAVHQTVVELPSILAAYLERVRRERFADRPPNSGFAGYLIRSARNIARDLTQGSWRHRQRLARLVESDPARLERTPTTPFQCGMRAEVRLLLDGELAALDALDRQIVQRRAAGESLSEIGRDLGMPRETVRDHFARASARLRRALQRALGGHPEGD